MHVVNNAGPMSREDLIDMSVQEGFFPDAQAAKQGVHPMLTNMLRSELIREFPTATLHRPLCRKRLSFVEWDRPLPVIKLQSFSLPGVP